MVWHRYSFISLVFAALILLATGASAATVTLTVHDYPTGDGPAGLVSNGIPFKPGAIDDPSKLRLMDGSAEQAIAVRVLARWHGDNSIRSALVQFNASFGGGTKDYELRIGESRTVPDLSLSTVTWDLPKKIATMPASYLCDSKVVWEQVPLGESPFPDWEQKQLDGYANLDFDNASLTVCANSDQFYNAIHTTYQMYARTGDLEYLVDGRRWALHHARDQIYLSGPNIGHGICSDISKTRYTYIQGLVDDYFLWGCDETRDVAGVVADNFYMTHGDNFYYAPPGVRSGFWSEREPAFALLGLIAYYEATNDVTYLNRATDRITALHQMQGDNGGAAFVHSLYDHDSSECGDPADFGISPWMTGLLLEGVIRYHQLTGSAQARESVLWALDYIKDNSCLASADYAGKSLIYMCGCTDPVYQDGVPDVDNLASHAFAYGYSETGSTEYQVIALDLMQTAIDNGWTGSAKHFNQQFRSSGHTVAYLSGGVPTLLANFSASFREPGISVSWELSEAGIDMEFFILRKREGDDYFVERSTPGLVVSGLNYGFIDTDVEPGKSYRYRVEVVDEDERRILFETSAIATPAVFVSLKDVYPNPFNPQATIEYTLPEGEAVRLRIYDAGGRLVRTLVDETRPAGTHAAVWNGLNNGGGQVASGVYYVRLSTKAGTQTRKAVLLK